MDTSIHLRRILNHRVSLNQQVPEQQKQPKRALECVDRVLRKGRKTMDFPECNRRNPRE